MAVKELTQGNPLKLIITFMLPILIGNLFQQFYNIVDGLIVGRTLGNNALGAVGSTMPFIFMVITFVFASTQGFTMVTAQQFGANNHDMVRKSFVISTFLSGILALFVTLISTPFTYKLLALLNTPNDIINLASNYLVIMFGGIFATVFYNLAANTIRALGDSKTPLYFLIFSALLNIALDLLFILKLHLGIKGAGYATITAELIATILCISFMFWKFPILRLKKEDFHVTKEFIYEHIRIGIPMGIQMSVLSIGVIALQFVLNSFGANAVTAFTAAIFIEQIFTQAYIALGATMAVYSAQNFGAKKLSRIKEGTKISLIIVGIITAIAVITISLFSRELIMMFMREINEEVITLAQQYLHILTTFLIFLGILILFRNILQGMGRVIAPLLSGIAELIGRTSCAFILGHYFGYTGICFATPAAWVGAAIVLYIGFIINLKKSKKILRTQ